jgi:hypothetical protein
MAKIGQCEPQDANGTKKETNKQALVVKKGSG